MLTWLLLQTCRDYNDVGKDFPEGLWGDVVKGITRIEKQAGKVFGDPKDPLLVSVRSGAAVSMPGMMDTVLNLGLNDIVSHCPFARSRPIGHHTFFACMFGLVLMCAFFSRWKGLR